MMERKTFIVTVIGAVAAWVSRSDYKRPPSIARGPSRRTREEQDLLDSIARERGHAWAERHAELILEQARSIGEL